VKLYQVYALLHFPGDPPSVMYRKLPLTRDYGCTVDSLEIASKALESWCEEVDAYAKKASRSSSGRIQSYDTGSPIDDLLARFGVAKEEPRWKHLIRRLFRAT
jgi:hypothetical protein